MFQSKRASERERERAATIESEILRKREVTLGWVRLG